MFNMLRPLIPSDEAPKEDFLKEDFKKSLRVEKFRIGKKAVYIPAGFFWKYLLKEDIRLVIKGRWLIQSDNGIAPFSMEAPALRLRHPGGETVLELEKEKNALKALELIGCKPEHNEKKNP